MPFGGHFIVMEGSEGAGKSVQVSRLVAWLRERGLTVIQTREPGGTPAGDAIREILLQSDHLHLASETEALLMSAARAQHVRELIVPAITAGETVVSDRYVDSTYAYQGGGLGLPMERLREIQSFATDGVMPDLRILLDLPVEVGLARRHGDADQVNRIDRAPIEYHERVRAMFLQLAETERDSWVVIDATKSIDEVSADIQAAVTTRCGIGVTRT